MKKKIAVLILAVAILAPGFAARAQARETQGNLIFTDTMYGAAIGGLIGLAAYAADDDQLGKKVGSGVMIGAVLGLAFGVYETKTALHYKDGKMVASMPTPEVEQRGKETIYKVSLFRADFK